MQINQMLSVQPDLLQANQKDTIASEPKSRFADYFKNAISEVNDLQIKSDNAATLFAKGKDINLHEVMIASQKASISMQAALEIRNKAVEAYQEIMRMQV